MESVKLLPVGSVVLLNNAEKPLMIIGIFPVNGGERHDYLAVMHPEGFISEKYVFMFDQKDIAEIKYIGYMDAAYQTFRSGLSSLMDKKE